MARYPTAIVLGMGDSGIAAARLLCSEGTSVTILDAADNLSVERRAGELEKEGIEALIGQRIVPDAAFAVCVLSPGVPSDSPWVRTLLARGVDVLSELELGWSRCGSRVLAITGSNGKSTMVKLCGDVLAAAGCRVELAGNYGTPVSEVALCGRKPDWLVLEVSSFQLETVVNFRPDVGVLLNIEPNHLDRHGNMEKYERIKARLFARMTREDVGVIPHELSDRMRAMAGGKNQWTTFGLSETADCMYLPGKVRYRSGLPRSRGQAGGAWKAGTEGEVPLGGTLFDNRVMGMTGAATVAAIVACGAGAEHAAAAAKQFEPLPHRMQTVAEIGGIRFVDDSEATNIAAMRSAIEMSDRPVRLIAGGILKETDLQSVKKLLVRKVVSVYLIGQSRSVLAAAWNDAVPCRLCADLKEAVKTAWEEGKEGESVLLSPACASFDQFTNCGERGECFSRIARRLLDDEKCEDEGVVRC